MAFGLFLVVAFLLSVWSVAEHVGVPDGALFMECHDRHLAVTVDIAFAGMEPYFEAVDGTAVHSINTQHAAQCGYSVSVLPIPGHVELRASYFSCHTDNQDDKVFTFNFNLVVMREGNMDTYALNKTCSPSLPWSPREVICEVNYMEVNVRSDVTCPSGTNKDWNALRPVHSSSTSDWQVMFKRDGAQLTPMSLSDARKRGYAFDLTDGRLVFRAPYGQPDALSTEMNGVPVEVVHATLFSRQGWVVLMVDLEAACSMHGGSYDDGGYMMWETPEALYPGLEGTQLNVGLNGELLEQPVAEERGYIVEKHNAAVQIGIPHDAEGAYRKSFCSGDLLEFYVFHLDLEQILVAGDHEETRLRYHRTLATSLMFRSVFSRNQTVLEDRMFTVYLGDVPEDVELAAVSLNGQEFAVPFTNTSRHTITKVLHPNNTRGYTLTVPFDDAVVVQQFSTEEAVVQYKLKINYTLMVLPENEPFYHLASVSALTDVSPPAFDAVCSKSGISFRLDHQPLDHLWEIMIGSDPLTSELAAKHGYDMRNNSRSLLLEVPLSSHGYEYKDVTLKGFFGTFEILMRDCENSEIQSSTIKTCPFSATELILCSTDGRMTVVADLPLAVSNGGPPAKINLVDKYCEPKEADNTRVLFSFPLNSCGSTVKLGKGTVTYENEIFFSQKYSSVDPVYSDAATERVAVQCTYPLAGLSRLFSVYRFESDAAGVGRFVRSTQPTAVLQRPVLELTAAPETTPAGQQVSNMPASHPPAYYIKVASFHNWAGGLRKRPQLSSQTRLNTSMI